MRIQGMKLFSLFGGMLIIQVYYPTVLIEKGMLNIIMATSIRLSKDCVAAMVLGFGMGVGYFPENKQTKPQE